LRPTSNRALSIGQARQPRFLHVPRAAKRIVRLLRVTAGTIAAMNGEAHSSLRKPWASKPSPYEANGLRWYRSVRLGILYRARAIARQLLTGRWTSNTESLRIVCSRRKLGVEMLRFRTERAVSRSGLNCPSLSSRRVYQGQKRTTGTSEPTPNVPHEPNEEGGEGEGWSQVQHPDTGRLALGHAWLPSATNQSTSLIARTTSRKPFPLRAAG
jgi:hypothetical protein